MRGLCLLALAAAGLLALVPFAADPLLDLGVEALDEVSAGAFLGSLLAVLVLVAVPVLLLGAVSPWALRLAVSSVEEAGSVAGRLYALSTAGSLVGTLVSALLLIPLVGTRRTFLMLRAGHRCDRRGRPAAGRRWALAPAAIVVLIALPVGALKAQTDRRRARDLRDRDAVPVRARDRAPRRHARARAERGPGGPLALRPRHRADRRLLGRPPGAAVPEPRRVRRAASRSSATPAARPRAPMASCSRARAWTASRSTASCRRSGAATSACAVRGCTSTPRMRGRSCAATRRPLRRDHGRRLPPALHPLLPDDARVLRDSSATGSRPAAW